jgi:oxidase EvaA|tara:strand:- start:4770 stop:6161 length:1392 start_codon:yes stop_codon:yes gene_type:complete
MGIKEFLKSYNSPVDECKLLSVLDQYRSTMDVNISRIAFAEMDKWSYSGGGDIVHESGKFFKIRGGESTNTETESVSYQPIIDQPEQGILGIVSRINDGAVEILLQAKIEPGNLDSVQYSPTVQATKSNYTGVHRGGGVIYVEKFLDNSDKVVFRGLQSEHGYKFYKKANYNVCVHDDDTEILDDKFIWLTLNDIRSLLTKEHCINMDTRSVLATIDFIGKSLSCDEIDMCKEFSVLERDILLSSLSEDNALYSFDEIYEWLSFKKNDKKINQRMVPLETLYNKDWDLSDKVLSSESNRNFELVGVRAIVGSREISSWCQPIVLDNIPKVYAFIFKKINNIIHVLVQAVEEDYSWNGSELGPSLHSISSETFSPNEEMKSFNINEDHFDIIYDRFQSEEGGRFMEQKNRYLIFLVNEDTDVKINDSYKWITLYQLKKMTKKECSVNIEARTLLSISSYYKGEI